MSRNIASVLSAASVIPVLTIAKEKDAVPLATTLVESGLNVLEVTLRTEVALKAIAAIARDVPKAIIGVGTVLTTTDLNNAKSSGAQFAVSPGLTEKLAGTNILPLLPGAASASEVMRARELGLKHLKFFPAESSGGIATLKAFAAPFADIRFCPTGGITAQSASTYLSLQNVMCVGGSWMVPQSLLDAHDWPAIAKLAREAGQLRG